MKFKTVTAALASLTVGLSLVAALPAQAATKPKPVRVSFAVAQGAAAPSTFVKVSGKINVRGKRYVVVQRKVGKRWTFAANVISTRKGRYTTRLLLPAKAGNYRYRAVVPRAKYVRPVRARGISVVRTIQVRNPRGTQANPYGQEAFRVKTDENTWQLKALYSEADVSVRQTSQGTTPSPGWQYRGLRLRLSNLGPVALKPSDNLDVYFLSARGNLFSFAAADGQYCQLDPSEDMTLAPQVAPGGTIEVTACAIIPADQVSGGMWNILARNTQAWVRA